MPGRAPIERHFASNAASSGFTPTKRGYPDFLVYRVTGDDLEFGFVELKSTYDELSAHQRFMLALLHLHGIPVAVSHSSDLAAVPLSKVAYRRFRDTYKQLFGTCALPKNPAAFSSRLMRGLEKMASPTKRRTAG
jgi:hypothetical protein